MDFIREELTRESYFVRCASGRGGEVRDRMDLATSPRRPQASFKEGQAELLRAPMRLPKDSTFSLRRTSELRPAVEPDEGRAAYRADRSLGPEVAKIRAVNLLYRDTIESDIYISLASGTICSSSWSPLQQFCPACRASGRNVLSDSRRPEVEKA